ncbi:TrmH family RNA methyltransferase [uncultured Victivallis sp.]|uniref:TrmH family RNA methyltransferase n=1 Tax=uncultured Victivallis sp. TaxID=354118 RepID=UPI0025D15D1D|nr:TrmH family RNA methyltransferase [uncultured Victivallis sp.]
MKLCLILDRLRSAHNTGNIFRIAEALGAEIIACGYTPAPPHPKLAKTAMGTDLTVPCRTMPDAVSAIRMLRNEGYRMILAAEPGPESVFAWEKNYEFPLAVVFGNEALGVSPEALAEVDGLVGLPMLGRKASINVGNAAAAILYAVVAVTQYGVRKP